MSASAARGASGPSRARAAWNAVVGVIATIFGLLPHVLHHVGLLVGVAVVSGTGGTILFALIGFAASIPLLLRLRRRFQTWRAPALALAVFVLMFSLSSFVIGPAISGDRDSGAAKTTTPGSHEQHHQP